MSKIPTTVQAKQLQIVAIVNGNGSDCAFFVFMTIFKAAKGLANMQMQKKTAMLPRKSADSFVVTAKIDTHVIKLTTNCW
mmetsp:Transcript_24332/g.48427  ORF Transcript_24332/g.48427 Transcript_24332/m.48427 type:complete len:80 (+) Transcript_24332:210-449(+)